LDFGEVGHSSPDFDKKMKQKSAVFEAGKCTVICSTPLDKESRAGRFLRKSPDGIGSLWFEVEDIEKTFKILEARGGTPTDEIQKIKDGSGTFLTFAITTPHGDALFRFNQRLGTQKLFPEIVETKSSKNSNELGFTHFDHVTTNFRTLSPAILWMEHVMGLKKFWEIQFHTNDVSDNPVYSSGLRSIVMWDPKSGVKFANNEPWRPNFRKSQIALFVEDLRGEGIQHVAIGVKDILPCVEKLRKKGLEFMPTPSTYYDKLPERIKKMGIGKIDEDIDELRKLEILMDGDGPHKYLLQIFLKDSAATYHEQEAGPFFYEIIQRKGNQGFGEGNFRALFDSIENEQRKVGRM
jgi:4-hydroxyphenylpyruvate dioxygenase